MKVLSSKTNLVDTAIGPVTVTISSVVDFDIDDFAHMALRSMAISLQIENAIDSVDTRFTSSRIPVKIRGKSVGGY